MPDAGDLAPDFTLPSTAGDIRLADLLHRGTVLLLFYAEDATPACSQQLSAFAEEIATLRDAGVQVVAIAAGTLDQHREFRDRLSLPFPLACDSNLAVARLYGVADEEEKRSRRAAFVIEDDGRIGYANPWYQPANPEHLFAVFRALGLA